MKTKILKLTIFLILIFLGIFASEVEAAVVPTPISNAIDLVNALGGDSVAISDSNKVTLKSNIDLDKEEFEILSDIELDLNGYTITSQAESTFITIKNNFVVSDTADKGKIEADIIFGVLENGTLKVNNGTFNSFFYSITSTNGKVIINNGEFNTFFYQVIHIDNSELTINNGKFNALYDDPMGAVALASLGKSNILIKNGSFYAKNSNAVFSNGEAKIEIDGGSFKSDKNNAISIGYNSNATINNGTFEGKLYGATVISSNMTINGGEFKGESALGVRSQGIYAGKLIINGGSFVASKYDGVYVEESDSLPTNPRMKIEINNGTFTGYYNGLYLDYAEGVVLKGGTFKSTAIADEDNYGGVFTVFHKPLSILADGYRYYDSNEATLKVLNGANEGYRTASTVTVGLNKYKIEVKDIINGKVSVDKIEASENEDVKINITPNDGYEIDSVKVTMKDSNKVLEVKDLTFKMQKGDAVVEVTFKQKVSIPAEDENITENPTTPEEPKEDANKEEINTNVSKPEQNNNNISKPGTSNIENPQTGDDIIYAVITLITSVLALGTIHIINRKK